MKPRIVSLVACGTISPFSVSAGGSAAVALVSTPTGGTHVEFSLAAVPNTGTYAVSLLLHPTGQCNDLPADLRAAALVVRHADGYSVVNGTTLGEAADAASWTPGAEVSLDCGTYFFATGALATFDYTAVASAECAVATGARLQPVATLGPDSGCMDAAAANFDASAAYEDASCVYAGGRGATAQT